MTDTPETDEAWDAVSRMPNGMYDSQVPTRVYAIAMSDHSKKMERERDSMRELVDRMGAMICDWRAGYGGQVASESCDCGDCEDILKLDAVIAAWKGARNLNPRKALSTEPSHAPV